MKRNFLSPLSAMMIGAGLLLFCGQTRADAVKITVSKPVIVEAPGSDAAKKFAAVELKRHLELMTGKNIPVIQSGDTIPSDAFPFYVGIAPPGDKSELQREEARHTITPKGVWLRGEDSPGGDVKNPTTQIFNFKSFRTGTLFAVYFFLENELGVKWIEPGDENIAFTPTPAPILSVKEFSWVPALKQRNMRPDSGWKDAASESDDCGMPKAMAYSKEEALKKDYDQKLWLKRMRMGSSIELNYGHAFVTWWEKYGKTHPEYFAWHKAAGTRGPFGKGWNARPDRVKMCVSCKGLHKQIVDNWLASKSGTINVCENDSEGYCECEECLKLDAPKAGEPFGTNLTDRYIWFAKEILKQAREKSPDARAVMYAYSVYLLPPRREKVPDGLVLGFVPSCLTENEKLDADYKAWRACGAKEMFLRPNDNDLNPGLPIGYDRKMFESFKVGLDNGIIGTDYDSLHGFWEISGLGNYSLARGSVRPDKDFDFWEDEYCSVFGPAKDDMREYLRHWRKIWDGKLYLDRERINEIGKYGNFRRGLMWKLTDYIKISDFDVTDAILERASGKNLTDMERNHLEKVRLANQHSRLALEAIIALSSKPAAEKLAASKKLLEFRIKNRDKINMCWPLLFKIEKEFGDLTGMAWAENLGGMTPVGGQPLTWLFKIDEKNEGLNENWQGAKWDDIEKDWKTIATTRPWENQSGILPQPLADKLKDYDGTGWYAARIKTDKDVMGRQAFLAFGAVDESCWVYVNGKKVGEHVFQKDDDWKTPFKIRIDEGFVDGEWQTVMVRVEDKGGMGGIYKPVWLAVK